jgi:hypothetical protein
MKTFQSSIIVLFASLVLLPALPQQEADAAPQIFRPRGKLIQRLRDDLNDGKPLIPPLFGDAEPAAKKPKTTAKKPTLAKSPQTGKTGKRPTPATREDVERQRRKAPTPAIGNGVNSKLTDQLPAEPSSVKTIGFGMIVRKVADSFVVTDVARGGNAAAEGVQRGDRIVAIGGAELMSLTEFEAIADAMRGGDRVEFEFDRKGKKNKAMVQFGTPEPPAADSDVAPSRLPATPTPVTTRRRLQDTYVPKPESSGLRSILEVEPAAGAGVKPVEDFDFPALNGPG